MVRNIEAALGGVTSAVNGTTPSTNKETSKKLKPGGKLARVAEGIRS
jgi:hypothetical protein